jgi:hypothetical protein
MKTLIFIAALSIALFSYLAYGEAAVPVDCTNDLLCRLNDFLSVISGKIPQDGMVIAVIAVLLEAGLRLFPTDKPRSILIGVSNLLMLLSEVCQKISVLLNKVIPQRLKEVPKLGGPK